MFVNYSMPRVIILILFFISLIFTEDWVKSTFHNYQSAVVRVINLNNGNVIGQGTGFIVSGDGVIVTNYHVVVGADIVEVVTIDDEKYNVDGFYTYDSLKDYVIMKIPGFDMPTIKLGNSKNISIGDDVVAIGNPLGLDNTITKGIISQIRKLEGYQLIQIDADLAPGSSGGPLFIKDGTVIGITTAHIPGENLNFAIPINYIRGELSKTEIIYPGDYFSTFTINQGNVSSCTGYEDVCLQLRNHDASNKSFEIYMVNNVSVAGFQCDLPGVGISGSNGGLLIENGFEASNSKSRVLAFSMQGKIISAGTGVLTEISYSESTNEVCMTQILFAGIGGTKLSNNIPNCLMLK